MKHRRSGDIGGVLLVVLAAIFWGTTGVAAKLSYGFGMSPEGILTLRLGLTAPIYAVYLLLGSVKKFSREAIAIGLLLLGPYHVAYYYSIAYVGVSTASLLLYTHPVAVALLSRRVLGESVSARTYVALLLSVAGAAFVSLGDLRFSAEGISLAVLSSLLFSLYVVFSKVAMTRGVRPGEVALGTSIWALPTVALFQIARGFNWVRAVCPEVVAIAAYLAFVVTALAYVLYMNGLRVVGAAKATIVSTAEPLTATLASLVLFAEPLTLLKAIGGFLIVAAVVLVAR
ncbi:MAG: EamA family transporter [Sulfolobales archaeon]|nr:EamA family transporter [Sulfolobales archaeon]MCX8209363.1 EamA family transporter [Sulfolobales archaeon]MDW8011048.1 EamA family transporter [Sulfolobales archaeon]